MNARYPDFFVIGAMKCATSSLHDQLGAIPGVFMSELKEPNFFSDDANYYRGNDRYLKHFAAAGNEDIVGESSTHYSKLPTYPKTLERLANIAPEAKFIYVMRHPVDRLVSHYIHEWSQRVISTGIDRALRRHPELLHYSRYYYQILPYIQAFGQERVLPVFFERLKQYPHEELQRIARFIGLPEGQCGSLSWRSQIAPSNVSSQRIRKFPLYNLLVESAAMRSIRRKLLPRGLRNRVKRRFTMTERPILSRDSWNHLVGIFDQDLKKLGSLLGVELNCANYRERVVGEPLEWREPEMASGFRCGMVLRQ